MQTPDTHATVRFIPFVEDIVRDNVIHTLPDYEIKCEQFNRFVRKTNIYVNNQSVYRYTGKIPL